MHHTIVQDYTAKLSDFGVAVNGPVDQESHLSTAVKGTRGYAAPEYIATGNLQNTTSDIMQICFWKTF
jgi:hypothetical protein